MKLYSKGITYRDFVNYEEQELLLDDTIIFKVEDSSKENIYKDFLKLYDILNIGARVILLLKSNNEMKEMFVSLMEAKEKYDIYFYEEDDEIVDKMLDRAVKSNISRNEFNTLIYNENCSNILNEIFTRVFNLIEVKDYENLIYYINDNMDRIRESVVATNLLKDNLNFLIKNINNGEDIQKEYANKKEEQVVNDSNDEELKNKIKELSATVDKLTNENQKNVELIKTKESEIVALTNDNAKLNKQVAQSNSEKNNANNIMQTQGFISKYIPINTAQNLCKAKIIIYIKEITPIMYITSFIKQIVEILQIKKLKVKLLCYPELNAFTSVYNGYPILDTKKYLDLKDDVLHKFTSVVIVEPNQMILDDILKEDLDVVIIYDKLGQKEDLVIGNNVYKYWVANSLKELEALKDVLNIDYENVISRYGVTSKGIVISNINDYQRKSSSAKTQSYMTLKNVGDNTKTILDIVFERTNINKLFKN